jgi:SAM-dependent methyltransferase
MRHPDADRTFSTTIAQVYESHLVPLLFAPYAEDLAERLLGLEPNRVLEIAAGTGIVTRALSARPPKTVSITATDLSPAMLERAIAAGTRRPVVWRQADALALPFDDATFDVVVCQFGVMFFPDKPRAFAEARRVLRPGGTFLFSVWARLEENEVADTVDVALASLLPHDPPALMRRTPHGYFDRPTIEADLREAGFAERVSFVTVVARSRAATPMVAAVAFCEGTPVHGEIEARTGARLAEATQVVAEAIGRRFGNGPVDGKMQAHVVSVVR